MNYSYLLTLLLFSFVLSCNSVSKNYQLQEVDAIASCVQYQIIDSENQAINLPKHIVQALDCPPLLDLTDGVLTYLDGSTIKLYRIKDKLDAKLFTMHEGMDGISNPAWSADRTQIMFVIINQNRTHGYKDFARIISLKLTENLSVLSKQKFDRPVNYVCGSLCSSHPYKDFKYTNEGISFKRNNNIEERPGEYEVIVLED